MNNRVIKAGNYFEYFDGLNTILELRPSNPGGKPGRNHVPVFSEGRSRVIYTASMGCYITTVVTPYQHGELAHYDNVERFNDKARKSALSRLS